MAIIKTHTLHSFCDEMKNEDYSYAALEVLFDYYDELSEGVDQNMELDPVAIRCDFTEYVSLEEAWNDYKGEPFPDSDEEAEDLLNDDTIVLSVKNGNWLVGTF